MFEHDDLKLVKKNLAYIVYCGGMLPYALL
jgi:hypothetical protein